MKYNPDTIYKQNINSNPSVLLRVKRAAYAGTGKLLYYSLLY